MEICRVCLEATAVELPVAALPARSYRHCKNCEAVFVLPDEHLSISDEASFYKLHENSSSDSRYRNYLAPVLEMAWTAFAAGLASMPTGALALDFGSGPLKQEEETVVCEFFREKGFHTQAYDPHFRPTELRESEYDLIVACEVVEHFRDPALELSKLLGLLRPGGVLAIQTEFFPGLEKFDSWYYRRDPTHVVFYSPRTFEVLAKRFGLEAHGFFDGKRVLFRKACQEISNPVS